MKGQRGFMNDSFQLSGSSSPWLSNHKKVCKAEIIELLARFSREESVFHHAMEMEKNIEKCFLI